MTIALITRLRRTPLYATDGSDADLGDAAADALEAARMEIQRLTIALSATQAEARKLFEQNDILAEQLAQSMEGKEVLGCQADASAKGETVSEPAAPLHPGTEWMPMSTAPHDRPILVAKCDIEKIFMQVVEWDETSAEWATAKWIRYPQSVFTHWTECPASPLRPSEEATADDISPP